jgi:hypothetical protein
MQGNELIEVELKINKAWSMLSGRELDFKKIEGTIQPDPDGLHFAIPIKFSPEDAIAAVALEISKSHAYNLSAFMFDLGLDELTEAEVTDACGEMCNVFSACVSNSFTNHKEGSLGVPCKLTADEFSIMFNEGFLDGYFKAANENGATVIYLFDPCLFFS